MGDTESDSPFSFCAYNNQGMSVLCKMEMIWQDELPSEIVRCTDDQTLEWLFNFNMFTFALSQKSGGSGRTGCLICINCDIFPVTA